MDAWEFLKHSVGGGLLTTYFASKVDEFVEQENIPDSEKPKYVGTGVGLMGGGVVGYYIGERIANHTRTYTLEEKAVSSALGAAGGAAAGYVLGSFLAKRLGEREKPPKGGSKE